MRIRRLQTGSEERRADAGFSLTELLVAAIIGGLVLTMLGGFLVSSLQADSQVRGLNTASARGELALDSLRTTLQSAAPPFSVAAGAASGDLIVRAAVAGSGTGALAWDCVAFYYDAARAELRSTRRVGTASTPGTRIATPNAATLAGWSIVASGMLPPASGAVFSLRDRDPGPAFEADTSSLEVSFLMDAGEFGTSPMRSSIVARSQPPGGVACSP